MNHRHPRFILPCAAAMLLISLSSVYADDLARRAGHGDAAAIAELRALGPAGLDRLLTYHLTLSGESQRITDAIDAVAAQKDAHVSRLYWHTDLDQAKSAARESGRPILSLRMLGNLDTDLSCANSRFFRTTLYANQQVSATLRERFVLHWQSVRPVPVITIDFGDGRTIERTITGNSAHYILDADGRPIDAIPGLYGPAAFLRAIEQARSAHDSLTDASESQRARLLQQYHSQRIDQINQAWNADLRRVGSGVRTTTPQETTVQADAMPALAADRVAVEKSAVERPILTQLIPTWERLDDRTDDAAWSEIARLHAADAQLDDASIRLIRAKQPAPSAQEAARIAMSKVRVEDPLLRMVRNLQDSIALDTIRNEYLLRAQIHQWFASAEPFTQNLDELNEKVYADLFLTPSSDPWLGLVPEDTFSALDNEGLRN